MERRKSENDWRCNKHSWCSGKTLEARMGRASLGHGSENPGQVGLIDTGDSKTLPYCSCTVCLPQLLLSQQHHTALAPICCCKSNAIGLLLLPEHGLHGGGERFLVPRPGPVLCLPTSSYTTENNLPGLG